MTNYRTPVQVNALVTRQLALLAGRPLDDLSPAERAEHSSIVLELCQAESQPFPERSTHGRAR